MGSGRWLVWIGGALALLVVVIVAPWERAPEPEDAGTVRSRADDAPPSRVDGIEEPASLGGDERTVSRPTEPLPARVALSGVVVRADGGVVPAESFVELLTEEGDPAQFVIVGAGGAFELELELGAWTLVARAPGMRSAARGVDFDDALDELRLVLEPTATLLLCLLEPGGNASPSLEVFVTAPSGERVSTRTAPDGCARFDDLFLGVHRVAIGHALHPHVAAFELDVAPPLTRPDPIVLPALAELRVRVVDTSGTPVAGARVVAVARGGGMAEAESDAQGSAVLAALAVGRVVVQASSQPAGQGDASVELEPGTNAELVLQLRQRR